MKKLLFFALVCLAAVTVDAQTISRPRVMVTRNGQTTSTVVLQAGAAPVFCEEYGDYVPAFHTLVREDTWVRNRENLYWRNQNNPNYRIPYGDLYKVSRTRYKLVAPPGGVVAVQPAVPAQTAFLVAPTHGQPGMVMAESPETVPAQSKPAAQAPVTASEQPVTNVAPASQGAATAQQVQEVPAKPLPEIRVRVVQPGQ